MKKTQLKAIATKIHGLAVKSANGKKTVQNKAIEKIAVLLNQAIEAEIKQAGSPHKPMQLLKINDLLVWEQ
jgi:hypothetical protein